ncbi:hypothetical protein SGQ83_19710 [Flavobacterium sp. Fl-318]|uniref:DNA-binding protein n=1 Tax=Flavobacterium cupriresistens TaxID=2893885 RepID=A0ABU4RH44_9FLAO|nr:MULTISPECIES: hypothetical protein [unclassified Flavobacterium]MDX6191591.1 hypothetical protein [Flavobacterium sp. Fl-318]UFH41538.1 hypothetical protein LNP23_17175 [Flavobacterium sp. F-323]
MEEKEIEAIKTAIKSKIETGDYITLSKVLGIKRSTGVSRYMRNNKSAVLCMQNIILEKEKMIDKLKKKYA